MQVVKLIDSEHVNENMVQNSSPTCKHNLFTLIQSKERMFVECPGMLESLKSSVSLSLLTKAAAYQLHIFDCILSCHAVMYLKEPLGE